MRESNQHRECHYSSILASVMFAAVLCFCGIWLIDSEYFKKPRVRDYIDDVSDGVYEKVELAASVDTLAMDLTHLTTQFDLDKAIGPRTVAEQEESEFRRVVYVGANVKLRGTAHDFFRPHSEPVLELSNSDLRVFITTSIVGHHIDAIVSDKTDSGSFYWDDSVIGREMIVTGRLERFFKPTAAQRRRCWQRRDRGGFIRRTIDSLTGRDIGPGLDGQTEGYRYALSTENVEVIEN